MTDNSSQGELAANGSTDETSVPSSPLPLAGAGGPVGGPVAGEVLDALNQPLLPPEGDAEARSR